MSTQYPGDDLVPDAVMVYDQHRTIKADAYEIFPWLQQIGKNRGGWYLPSSWDKFMPTHWRASRTIESRWQNLKVGDRINDYGLRDDDYFYVVQIEPPNAIVFR